MKEKKQKAWVQRYGVDIIKQFGLNSMLVRVKQKGKFKEIMIKKSSLENALELLSKISDTECITFLVSGDNEPIILSGALLTRDNDVRRDNDVGVLIVPYLK